MWLNNVCGRTGSLLKIKETLWWGQHTLFKFLFFGGTFFIPPPPRGGKQPFFYPPLGKNSLPRKIFLFAHQKKGEDIPKKRGGFSL